MKAAIRAAMRKGPPPSCECGKCRTCLNRERRSVLRVTAKIRHGEKNDDALDREAAEWLAKARGAGACTSAKETSLTTTARHLASDGWKPKAGGA